MFAMIEQKNVNQVLRFVLLRFMLDSVYDFKGP